MYKPDSCMVCSLLWEQSYELTGKDVQLTCEDLKISKSFWYYETQEKIDTLNDWYCNKCKLPELDSRIGEE